MVAALYRRYRPESFAELIGQAHVTDPLRTALRADRVNHAYLFSGPRGCGKTTSARILARCLNCAEGPTPDPCGVCDSCIELGRDGGGSLDVVEIDAASHGGVDDARDLRERATFAPSRDRYKVFIIDEAHMVTSGGFNALLKIVEEPPEHIKFIFATTEPDKVIGTIRSRTHHYPFRLIAPAPMLEYVQQLCAQEGVEVDPGVLPLVVRAGGGSARDTLSLLDQLIAGSEARVTYESAVALLGFTHGELLDEIVGALSATDASKLFASIDRVVQSGQDPRRFVEDLLERLRDLIVAHAAADPAAILHGVPEEELRTLVEQAGGFGAAELSRAADIVAKSLTDMAGATSPRLHLELMAARLLVPETGEPEVGTLARVERLEQRLDGAAPAPAATPTAAPAPAAASSATPAPVGSASADPGSAGRPEISGPRSGTGSTRAAAAESVGDGPAEAAPAAATEDPIEIGGPDPAGPPVPVGSTAAAPSAAATAAAPSAAVPRAAAAADAPSAAAPAAAPVVAAPAAPITFQQLRDSWDEVLQQLADQHRAAWMLVSNTTPIELRDGDVLVLGFQSDADVQRFREGHGGKPSVADLLRTAITSLLGIEVKYIPRIRQGQRASGSTTEQPSAAGDDVHRAASASAPSVAAPAAATAAASAPVSGVAVSPGASGAPASRSASAPAPSGAPGSRSASAPVSGGREASPAVAAAVTGWAVAAIPSDAEAPPEDLPEQPLPDEPEPDPLSFVSAPEAPALPVSAPAAAAPRPAPSGPSLDELAQSAPAPEPALSASQAARYGEAVVREELGAELIEERPRVRGER
ncbi:DNA polymerase-3 subunit gamma/tau [Agrococcus baldri]|uniref:DNA-directed DNA polymerase n=1 Tax=Agrococcus baldri TaxID=153730 RepID=A0AA94HLC8_9MICO|nr:DNA polymerase III subunit gamma and tau [Agrococcus baldri]SFS06636.1 DNA polymerase-3 subunit gamma/tau [Agrococcus baldri]